MLFRSHLLVLLQMASEFHAGIAAALGELEGIGEQVRHHLFDEARICLTVRQRVDAHVNVTLRFGGQPKSLSIPYAAITHFYDPSVEYQLRFTAADSVAAPMAEPPAAPAGDKAADGPNIVSLDQFRKK